MVADCVPQHGKGAVTSSAHGFAFLGFGVVAFWILILLAIYEL